MSKVGAFNRTRFYEIPGDLPLSLCIVRFDFCFSFCNVTTLTLDGFFGSEGGFDLEEIRGGTFDFDGGLDLAEIPALSRSMLIAELFDMVDILDLFDVLPVGIESKSFVGSIGPFSFKLNCFVG